MSAGTAEKDDPRAAESPAEKPRRFRVLNAILMVLVACIAVILGLAALQPDEFRVTRSITIDAPPAAVFAHVNDFHQWDAWSPWAKLDPNARNSFEGPPAGEGAILRWDGNDDVGAGSMTILVSRPSELIRIQLHFIRPFEDTATVEFTFQPEGNQTNVTWSMFGQNNFVGRVMCLFMNMDEMIGRDFERGLTSLKSVVETAPGTKEGAAAESTTPNAS